MVQTTNNTIDNTTYTLSIQVSLNGLSFCIVSSDYKIITLEEEAFGIQLSPDQVLEKIKNIFDHSPHLKYSFKTIEVIYQNDLCTFVPKALFDKELLNQYLKYSIKVLENDFIAYDELDQHEIVTVYIPYININNFFFETFGSFTYKHSSSILIDTILRKNKNKETTTVYAHMNSKYFDLLVVEKGKLVLGNTYLHETKEDFLYYLMFATEQLQLNPEEFQLLFVGNIAKNSDYYTIARTYIRNVDFGKRDDSYEIPETVSPFDTHQHFVLLSHF